MSEWDNYCDEIGGVCKDMEAQAARIAELEADRDRMREALAEAVEKYGKPGGPWNIPGESGSWIAKAREALEGAEG